MFERGLSPRFPPPQALAVGLRDQEERQGAARYTEGVRDVERAHVRERVVRDAYDVGVSECAEDVRRVHVAPEVAIARTRAHPDAQWVFCALNERVQRDQPFFDRNLNVKLKRRGHACVVVGPVHVLREDDVQLRIRTVCRHQLTASYVFGEEAECGILVVIGRTGRVTGRVCAFASQGNAPPVATFVARERGPGRRRHDDVVDGLLNRGYDFLLPTRRAWAARRRAVVVLDVGCSHLWTTCESKDQALPSSMTSSTFNRKDVATNTSDLPMPYRRFLISHSMSNVGSHVV